MRGKDECASSGKVSIRNPKTRIMKGRSKAGETSNTKRIVIITELVPYSVLHLMYTHRFLTRRAFSVFVIGARVSSTVDLPSACD